MITSGGPGPPSSSAWTLKPTHEKKNVLHCPRDIQYASDTISSISRSTFCSLGCCLCSRYHNFLPRSLPAFSNSPCIFLPSNLWKVQGAFHPSLKSSVTSLACREQKACSSAFYYLLGLPSLSFSSSHSIHGQREELWLLVTSLAWLSF